MFHEQYTRPKPIAVIVTPDPLIPWTPEAMIDVFARLLIDGWLDPSRMSPQLAGFYATRLFHYGRLLQERQHLEAEIERGA